MGISAEYVDGRLIIELEIHDGKKYPTIHFDTSLLNHPKILQLLKSDEIYFRFPGSEYMNYSEFLENERDNERRRLARLARMNTKKI